MWALCFTILISSVSATWLISSDISSLKALQIASAETDTRILAQIKKHDQYYVAVVGRITVLEKDVAILNYVKAEETVNYDQAERVHNWLVEPSKPPDAWSLWNLGLWAFQTKERDFSKLSPL